MSSWRSFCHCPLHMISFDATLYVRVNLLPRPSSLFFGWLLLLPLSITCHSCFPWWPLSLQAAMRTRRLPLLAWHTCPTIFIFQALQAATLTVAARWIVYITICLWLTSVIFLFSKRFPIRCGHLRIGWQGFSLPFHF